MALGEVYYHLLPSFQGSPDSLAEAEFRMAAADTRVLPSTLSPSRDRDPARHTGRRRTGGERLHAARSMPARQPRAAPCDAGVRPWGARGGELAPAAAATPLDALRAAAMLAAAGAFPDARRMGSGPCSHDSTARWRLAGAGSSGYRGSSPRKGGPPSSRGAMDSASRAGSSWRTGSTCSMPSRGGRGRRRRSGGGATSRAGAGMFTRSRWLRGTGMRRYGQPRGNGSDARRAGSSAASRSHPGRVGSPASSTARSCILKGDTAGAIGRLRSALSVGRRKPLDWDVGESLAPDRLLLRASCYWPGGSRPRPCRPPACSIIRLPRSFSRSCLQAWRCAVAPQWRWGGRTTPDGSRNGWWLSGRGAPWLMIPHSQPIRRLHESKTLARRCRSGRCRGGRDEL